MLYYLSHARVFSGGETVMNGGARLKYRHLIRAAIFGIGSLSILYCSVCIYFSNQIIGFTPTNRHRPPVWKQPTKRVTVPIPSPISVTIPVQRAKISAWHIPHPQNAGCGVVFYHGYTGFRAAMLKYVPLMWKRGCHLLLLDARYHGVSGGEVPTWGSLERYDLIAAAKFLGRAHKLPLSRIGLYGESLGASIALQAAAIIPSFAFVIADSPFSDVVTIIKERGVADFGNITNLFADAAIYLAGKRAGFAPWDLSAARDAAKIKSPVLLIHSQTDDFTPYNHSQRIYARLNHKMSRLVITKWNAKHGKSIDKNYEKYEKIVDGFICDYVPTFNTGKNHNVVLSRTIRD